MLLAELDIRHTRRHMPTRRVALGDSYLPTSGVAHGAVLLGAVVAEFLGALDEEDLELLPRLLADARHGMSVPRIAIRYRLQTDRHGLDRSRHRIFREEDIAFALPVLELDVHGRSVPQVLGAVLAAASLPSTGRRVALRAIEKAIEKPGVLPGGFRVVRLFEGVPGGPPLTMPGRAGDRSWAGAAMDAWAGLPSERRWAMEVLGIRPPGPADRDEIQRRFRRLLREAHPDQGGALPGAAERIAELTEARELLLSALTAAAEPAGG